LCYGTSYFSRCQRSTHWHYGKTASPPAGKTTSLFFYSYFQTLVGEILLQQRAFGKYHTPGLWTNTCCSHQRPNEETLIAAHRRLVEEMGFDCVLHEVYEFVYKVPFENGLWEHEFDHVLIGRYDGKVSPNPEEVNAYRWVSMNELKQNMKDNPRHYTPWFHIILDEHYDRINAKIKKINF